MTRGHGSPIGVGVIGCGEIAQLMHLPILHELPDLRIAALCDLSETVLERLGAHYGIAARHTDYRAMLADPAVDLVIVCSHDHAPVALDALAAGKHVVVEKPLAFTVEEGRPVVAAAGRSGLVALIGSMKFYDPGDRIGLKRIADVERPKTIQVHDFAGRFDRYQQLYTQVRADDVDPALLRAGKAATEARVKAALGPDHEHYLDLYMTLLMLGSHDLAVLRGAFGAQYEWWDEWMTVHGEHDEVRIEFANPYVRNTAATVRLREAAGAGASERVLYGTPDTAFRRQWVHTVACVRDGITPLTPLSGGLEDLELAERIKALPPKPLA